MANLNEKTVKKRPQCFRAPLILLVTAKVFSPMWISLWVISHHTFLIEKDPDQGCRGCGSGGREEGRWGHRRRSLDSQAPSFCRKPSFLLQEAIFQILYTRFSLSDFFSCSSEFFHHSPQSSYSFTCAQHKYTDTCKLALQRWYFPLFWEESSI